MKASVIFCILGLLGAAAADYKDATLACHNAYRQKHHVSDLTLSTTLNTQAQAWADHMANTNTFQHSNTMGKYGENIYMRSITIGSKEDDSIKACDLWYSEESQYDYTNPTYQKGTGHFTQIVWKDSHELGVGYAVGSNNHVYVVAQYSPAGNWMSRFAENVLQP